MPLISRENLAGKAQLILWDMQEAPESLADLPVDWARYDAIKAPNKKREWVGRQWLFKEAGLLNKVRYLANGKPVLDKGYLSISHCDHLAAVILSENPIGIDVQNPNPKLFRIKQKFCNERELLQLGYASDALSDITRIWSSKEAVFKVYGENVAFAQDLDVHLLDETQITCRVSNRDEAEFDLLSRRIDDYYLIFTHKKRSPEAP